MTMAEFFSALLRNLILPPALLFVPLAIGLLLRQRWRRTGNLIAGSALALLYLSCTSFGANLLVAPLEARTQALAEISDSGDSGDSGNGGKSGAQAIVVLAAGSLRQAPEYEGLNIPDYIALARLRYAAHLHRKTGLPILASGGKSDADSNEASKAEEMAKALSEDFGVPVEWTESRSHNTDQNARFSVDILKHQGIDKILLVTDAMHMPRSKEIFEYYNMTVVPAPTAFQTNREWNVLQFLPGPEGLRKSWYACYEWIGLFWYRFNTRQPAGLPRASERTTLDAAR